MRYIWVTYEAGQDLYTVEYFRVKRNDYAHITLEKMEGVYCDMLSEVVYSMVNK